MTEFANEQEAAAWVAVYAAAVPMRDAVVDDADEMLIAYRQRRAKLDARSSGDSGEQTKAASAARDWESLENELYNVAHSHGLGWAATSVVRWLRITFSDPPEIDLLRAEVERLTKERDEAREALSAARALPTETKSEPVHPPCPHCGSTLHRGDETP